MQEWLVSQCCVAALCSQVVGRWGELSCSHILHEHDLEPCPLHLVMHVVDDQSPASGFYL